MSKLDDFVEKSSSELLKSAVAKLTIKEKVQFGVAIDKVIADNADVATVQAREMARELNGLKQRNTQLERLETERVNDIDRYKGFRDTLVDPDLIEWGGRSSRSTDEFLNIEGVKEGYLVGVAEAVKYLATKPDQIIQHLQDPNPVEKVIQHRKDQQYSGI